MTEIPKAQLKAFYLKVGKTMVDWLGALECSNCKEQSSIDWMLEFASCGHPQLICRNCGKRYPIDGLGFKKQTVEDPLIELKHFLEKRRMIGSPTKPALTNKVVNI
jgi:hypothetical protein